MINLRLTWETQRDRHLGLGLVLDLARAELCVCLLRRNVVIGWDR